MFRKESKSPGAAARVQLYPKSLLPSFIVTTSEYHKQGCVMELRSKTGVVRRGLGRGCTGLGHEGGEAVRGKPARVGLDRVTWASGVWPAGWADPSQRVS